MLWCMALLAAVAIGIGIGASGSKPSPANPPVGPTKAGTPGIATPETPSTQTPP